MEIKRKKWFSEVKEAVINHYYMNGSSMLFTWQYCYEKFYVLKKCRTTIQISHNSDNEIQGEKYLLMQL